MSRLAISCFTVIMLASSARSLAQDSSPPAPTDQDSRIAELEGKLKDALARIEQLEAEVEKLSSAPAGDKATKPQKPAAASKAADAATGFVKGAKLSGSFTGEHIGTVPEKGEVVKRDGAKLLLQLKNSYGEQEWEIKIAGNKAELLRVSGAPGVGGVPTLFLEIKVRGTISANKLSLAGNWRVKSGTSNRPGDIRLELTVE